MTQGTSRTRRRFRPLAATREAIGDARELRATSETWTKNRNRLQAQMKAFQGLVFWNTLERNKVGRTVPLQAALVAGYAAAALLRDTFLVSELATLLFGIVVWYALEVVNSTFEYLLDELHGTHFDERYARIKDMGAGASSLIAVGVTVAAVMFAI